MDRREKLNRLGSVFSKITFDGRRFFTCVLEGDRKERVYGWPGIE
jgi:hypothetical protein